MPLCKCLLCFKSTSGQGKNLHKSTITRHMKRDEENKELLLDEDSENFMDVDDNNDLLSEFEVSHGHDNPPSEYDGEVSHGHDNPPSEYDDEVFHGHDNLPSEYDDEVSHGHNSPSEFYDDDEVFFSDLYYDENDCELDELDNDPSEESLIEGLRLLYVKSNFNFSEAAFNDIIKAFRSNSQISLFKIKSKLKSLVG